MAFSDSQRRAAAELGVWLAAIAALFAVGFALRQVAPTLVLILAGEPLQMTVLLLVSTALMRRGGQSWRDLGLAWPASGWRTAGLVAGGLVMAYVGVAIVRFGILKPLGLAAADLKAVVAVMKAPIGYPVMMLLTWTTVAFGEEMQFRGFLFSRLETLFGSSRGGTLAAWLAQGAVFGCMHGYQGLGGILTTAVPGLVLGSVYLSARRNLAACIILHGVIDTIGLTAALYVAGHPGAVL